MTRFGQHLRHWRTVRGLSQLELALRAGTSPRHVSFVETGRSRPRRAWILRLADVLEVPEPLRAGWLGAAGLAPVVRHVDLDVDLDASAARSYQRAVREMLGLDTDVPAVLVGAAYRTLEVNAAAAALLPELRVAPTIVDAFLADSAVPRVANADAVLWGWYERLLGDVTEDACADTQALLDRVARRLRGRAAPRCASDVAAPRGHAAAMRDAAASRRGHAVIGRGPAAAERDATASGRGPATAERDAAAPVRGFAAAERNATTTRRAAIAGRGLAAVERDATSTGRGSAAAERNATGRGSAAMVRAATLADRDSAAVATDADRGSVVANRGETITEGPAAEAHRTFSVIRPTFRVGGTLVHTLGMTVHVRLSRAIGAAAALEVFYPCARVEAAHGGTC